MEILFFAGMILSLVGWLWLVVLGFQDHWAWGVGILIIGILGLVYGFMNFQKAKIPTLLLLGGIILYFIGGGMAMQGGIH
jgi:hypothetical protein